MASKITLDIAHRLNNRPKSWFVENFGMEERWIDSDYNFIYDCDEQVQVRGTEEFYRPGNNVFKLGLNVSSRYGGASWLDETSGWPVSYHGTDAKTVGLIVNKGYISGGRQAYAKEAGAIGVYSAPKINTAANFSTQMTIDGFSYFVMLMNRVNPHTRKSCETTHNGHYWVSETKKEGEHTHDVRPYALLLVPAVGDVMNEYTDERG